MRLDPGFWGIFQDVLDAADDEGIDVELVSGYRSLKEQARLYAQYRAGRSSLPAAPPGASYHNFGLAIDVAARPSAALQRVGEIAEDFGLRWGGHFGDPPHIDWGSKIPLATAKKRFRENRLVEVE